MRATRFIVAGVKLLLLAGALSGTVVFAQPAPSPSLQPDQLMMLMRSQPRLDTSTPVAATAWFDPPLIGAGSRATYRVTFNALEGSVRWPEAIPAPPELKLRRTVRGQMLRSAGAVMLPLAAFNFEARPTTAGSFSVPSFDVEVYGQRVTVPATQLQVVPAGTAPLLATPRLVLQAPATNVYVGQPVDVRVLFPSTGSNVVHAVSSVEFDGEGFLVDQRSARRTITTEVRNGQGVPTFIHEVSITPFVRGSLALVAHAFTTGNQFGGPIVIQGQVTIPGGPPQYLLVESDPVNLNVRPLPDEGRLAGFMGAIGRFTLDPPHLETNVICVGDPVKLFVTVRGEGNVDRLVAPPPPRVPDWQVLDAGPLGQATPPPPPTVAQPPPQSPPGGKVFTFTLIPLGEAARRTPAIPFSYFDPAAGEYVDLTIPGVPVTVVPGETVAGAKTPSRRDTGPRDSEEELVLSPLAASPGRTAASLVPLPLRPWFPAIQLLPAIAFAGLWLWDRRRRYLEQHPDIVLRRRARRALRREQRALRKAALVGDERNFALSAVRGMCAACAPHYPAEPRALVCGDVLQVLGGPDQVNGDREIVRRVFDSVDSARFDAPVPEPQNLISLQSEIERVFANLEARL